ncbi:MAG: hypothetical protein EA425_18045 [Puniceicoccaceae bacterium]|nr:MAG: hypothetical protein EA425_18045 [Puniceicoccaceae bacterium]
MDPSPIEIAPGLWTLDFPLRLAGLHLGRRVTLLGSGDGGLIIHSTAPFTEEAVAAVRALGRPLALVEGTLLHDTFAAAGRAAFPDLPSHAPEGRGGEAWLRGARPLAELEELTGGAVRVHAVAGIPAAREHVIIHPATGTAVVCDLIFNLQPPQPFWTMLAFKYLNRCYGRPGMTRLFKSLIKDRPAFVQSLEQLLAEYDFDRLIPAHGQVVETGAKALLQQELADL